MVDIATKRKILIEYGAGASISALSKKFTLSRPTISKILNESIAEAGTVRFVR